MKTNLDQVNDLHNIDLYLYFYEDFIDEGRTKRECQFIIRECGLNPGNHILDLACGHGRHSLYFARNQYSVTGIDINRRFIEHAQKMAKERALTVDFKVDNMLNLDATNAYDGIILLFNGFGFLDREDGVALLQKLKLALKKEGKLFLDIKNRDSLLRELKGPLVTEKGKDLMIDRLSFDPKTGTTSNNRIYIKDGIRYDTPFTMQMYSYTELEKLLADNGLVITKSYGDWSGNAFSADSRRIIAVMEHMQ